MSLRNPASGRLMGQPEQFVALRFCKIREENILCLTVHIRTKHALVIHVFSLLLSRRVQATRKWMVRSTLRRWVPKKKGGGEGAKQKLDMSCWYLDLLSSDNALHIRTKHVLVIRVFSLLFSRRVQATRKWMLRRWVKKKKKGKAKTWYVVLIPRCVE